MLPLQYCECTDGSHVEVKASALVWHYGDADPDFGNWQVSYWRIWGGGGRDFARHRERIPAAAAVTPCCQLCCKAFVFPSDWSSSM